MARPKGSHDLKTLALAAHQLINEQYRILNDVLTPFAARARHHDP